MKKKRPSIKKMKMIIAWYESFGDYIAEQYPDLSDEASAYADEIEEENLKGKG